MKAFLFHSLRISSSTIVVLRCCYFVKCARHLFPCCAAHKTLYLLFDLQNELLDIFYAIYHSTRSKGRFVSFIFLSHFFFVAFSFIFLFFLFAACLHFVRIPHILHWHQPCKWIVDTKHLWREQWKTVQPCARLVWAWTLILMWNSQTFDCWWLCLHRIILLFLFGFSTYSQMAKIWNKINKSTNISF